MVSKRLTLEKIELLDHELEPEVDSESESEEKFNENTV